MESVEFSSIVTCYFEERSIDEFYTRLRRTLEATRRSFEIVMVNDGSTDGTLAKLREIHARSTHVTVVDLLRNFGQGYAMTAGVAHATGRNFIFMDSDLQLDPEDLPKLLEEFDKGYDVVSGVRANRRDPLKRKLGSWVANKVLRRLTRAPFTDFGCTYKIYRGALMNAMQLGPSRPYTLLMLRLASRFKEVQVGHHPRRYGKSGWSFPSLFNFMLGSFLLLERTFQIISVLAFVVAMLTFIRIALAWAVPGSLLGSPITNGLILNSLLLSTAALLVVQALVGEYVIRIHAHQLSLPGYIVRDVWRWRVGTGEPSARAPDASPERLKENVP
jgi:glycosyltransferase involved in cell wall biosynthesis